MKDNGGLILAEVLSRSEAMKLDKVRIVGEELNKIIEAEKLDG